MPKCLIFSKWRRLDWNIAAKFLQKPLFYSLSRPSPWALSLWVMHSSSPPLDLLQVLNNCLVPGHKWQMADRKADSLCFCNMLTLLLHGGEKKKGTMLKLPKNKYRLNVITTEFLWIIKYIIMYLIYNIYLIKNIFPYIPKNKVALGMKSKWEHHLI